MRPSTYFHSKFQLASIAYPAREQNTLATLTATVNDEVGAANALSTADSTDCGVLQQGGLMTVCTVRGPPIEYYMRSLEGVSTGHKVVSPAPTEEDR